MSESVETAHLTADVVLLACARSELHVLLIERGDDPFAGRLALPGGHVDPEEEVEAAARRELAEETGLSVERIDLVGVYSAPGRDPRGRYVTFVFVALLDHLHDPTAGDDACDAHWYPVGTVLDSPEWLAFDHAQIIADAAASAGGGR